MIARASLLCLSLIALAPASALAQRDDTIASAERLLNTGEYDQVIDLLKPLLSSPDTSGAVVVPYLEAYLHSGNYSQGLTEARRLTSAHPEDPFAHYMAGRLLRATGNYSDANDAFRTAGRLRRNFWRNAIEYADILYLTGDRRNAGEISSTIVSAYKQGYFKTAETLTVAGRAAVLIGEYRDANEAFRTANSIDPANVDNLIHWGRIFQDKYNEADARRTFDEALRINPNRSDVYTGLALSSPGFAAKEQLANRALAANPNDINALGILSTIHLLDGRFDDAAAVLEKAMAVNPNDLALLSHSAALALVRSDTAQVAALERKALAVSPQPVEFYTILAEDLALRFRYEDALIYSQRAVDVDPGNSEALASLGSGLLRLGRSDEARRYLNRAFERDRFNLFVGNMLTLIDSYEAFSVVESEHFELLIHNDEKDVLAPLILDEAEKAYASLAARYPYRPENRIVIEAYNDADDFAVRIAGIPHLGLLGVAFGDVVAINTPKAQQGQYNWSRTLWHELAHTMAIGVSNNRVPRWFTEGLSVYEEYQARPDWAREMELQFYSALDRDKLHSLDNMGRGFTRPEFPGQVLLSYYHASQIIEYMSSTFGFDAVIAVLQNLGSGMPIESALESATGQSLASLDRAIFANLNDERQNFNRVLNGMPDLLGDGEGPSLADPSAGGDNQFLKELRAGYHALEMKDTNLAERHLKSALEMYPAYVGAGNAYLGLAAIYRERNDRPRLVNILEKFLEHSDYGVNELRELASLYGDQGDSPRASAMLRRSLDVDPYDIETRQRLADQYLTDGQHDLAVRENLAVLALNPIDRADAYYELARAYFAGADVNRAKRAVLQSLEIAPGFRDAQKLLLACVDGTN